MQLIKSPAKDIKDQAVIYEVNLTIDNEVIDEFDTWLQKHVDEMLAIPGFISANTLVIENNDEATKQRSVQYRLVNQAALDSYFENDAERMRAEGLEKFPNKMTAQRRILTPSQAALAEEAACANCGTQLEGRFCSSCGQREEPRVPTVMSLIREASNAMFGLESKLWQSINVLLFKPGQLTVDYLVGKRQRYTSPIRLYLLLSIITFAYLFSIGSEAVVDIGPIDAKNIQFDLNKEDINIFPSLLPMEIEDALKDGIIDLGESVKHDLEIGNFKKILAKILKPLPKALLLFLPFIAVVFKLVYLGTGKYYIEHLIYLLHNHVFIFIVILFSMFVNQVTSKNLFLDFWLGFILFILMAYLFFNKKVKKYKQEFKLKWFRVCIKTLIWFALFYSLFENVLEEGAEVIIGVLWFFVVPYYFYRSMRVVYNRGRYLTLVNYLMIFMSYLFLWSVMLILTIIFAGYNYN